jgi:hypothetical protein
MLILQKYIMALLVCTSRPTFSVTVASVHANKMFILTDIEDVMAN